MTARWSNRALESWQEIATYIYYRFGSQVADDYESKTNHTVDLLVAFPEMGREEPLLQDRNYAYRSLNIDKLSKIVYFVSDDVLYIADVWNLRRNPEILTYGL